MKMFHEAALGKNSTITGQQALFCDTYLQKICKTSIISLEFSGLIKIPPPPFEATLQLVFFGASF